MAVHGRLSDIYRNGTDLSLACRAFELVGTREFGDCTNFNDASREWTPGLKSGSISIEGLWDSSFEEIIQRTLGNDSDVTVNNREPQEWQVYPGNQESTALGAVCYQMQTVSETYQQTSVITDIVSFTLDGQSNTGLQRAKVIQENAPQSSTGTGSTTDNGASTAGGADFVLMFSSISGGTPSVTVTVKGSTDNFVSNSSTLGTFTAYTGASSEAAAERISVDGTIPRYVRCEYTLSGGTTSSTFWVTEHRK